MDVKRILVDLDPTRDEQPALERAIKLAQTFGASLDLLLVVYNSHLMNNNLFSEAQLKKAQQAYLHSQQRWLDTYSEQVNQQGIQVTSEVCWHKPVYEAINEKALALGSDWVVKSTHRHPTINKLLFTPNDWQLLKTCPVPLLLVKQSADYSDYQHILAAIDPSSHNKPVQLNRIILKNTIELTEIMHTQPHAAHCFESIGQDLWSQIKSHAYDNNASGFEYDDYIQNLEQTNRQEFHKLLSHYPIDEKRQHLKFGTAYEQLPKIVNEHHIDLMVIGTTYRTGLIGSTAERILDDIHCDLLALKSE